LLAGRILHSRRVNGVQVLNIALLAVLQTRNISILCSHHLLDLHRFSEPNVFLIFFPRELYEARLTSHLATLRSDSPLLSAMMRLFSLSERRTAREATAM
jgi:hypothetical protein